MPEKDDRAAAASQPGEARAQLRELLAELGTLARRPKAKPNRYHARDGLLALGRLALEEGEEEARPWVGRLRAAALPFAEGFEEAVKEELALATDEHVRGVDPRYLDHPRYDLEYAVLARERLEQRLVAAELLGLAPAEALLERVTEADRLLEPYLRRAAGPEGGT